MLKTVAVNRLPESIFLAGQVLMNLLNLPAHFLFPYPVKTEFLCMTTSLGWLHVNLTCMKQIE